MRGPGVVCPLEGNVISRQVVVNAATAREHLRCEWTYDYTPHANTIPMYRAPALTSEAWAAYQKKPAPMTLLLNEPNNASADGDGASAQTVAGLLRDVTLDWCGPNCLITADGTGTAWERAYVAAGGKPPTRVGAHFYAFDGLGLETDVRAYRAHLVELGWGSLPLVLTEVGGAPSSAHYASTHEKRAGILRAAFGLMQRGEIASFAWFSARMPGLWSHNDLLRSDGSLTDLGVLYRALATGQPGPVALKPGLFFPVARR